MNALAQARRMVANLAALGAKRLAALSLVGALLFALTGFAGWYLSRPTQETLHSGLHRDHVGGNGAHAHDPGGAIRKLVASAVPGMRPEEVTVLDVDGQLLASGSESLENAPDNLLALQLSVSHEVRDSITRTLSPYLNPRNFQVSVAARLNADKMQTSETTHDPDKRAERTARETTEKQN